METPRLIGLLCMAANKAEIELTATQLERMGNEFESLLKEESERARVRAFQEYFGKERKCEREFKIYEESIPMTDETIAAHKRLAEEIAKRKKSQEPATDSKIESVDAPAEAPAPEQPKPDPKVSKPKTAKEKTKSDELTPRQKEMWDYIQAHPDAGIKEICAGMGITDDNYYFLKRKLKEKGYVIPTASDASKNTQKHGRNILANMGKIHAEEKSEIDKRMEDAYLGEHPNIQPEPVAKKPVSKQARRLYEYMQSHPDSRMPKTCEDLNITNAEYYMLKADLKRNGWIESAVENVKAY